MDFKAVLHDREEVPVIGRMIGSSYQLLKELKDVAPTIGIELEDGELPDEVFDDIVYGDCPEGFPYHAERAVWLALYERATISIQHKIAIVFH